MTEYPWAILHHDGIAQYVRVPSDNGPEWVDLQCVNLKVHDEGDYVIFEDGARSFRVLRDKVQTHLVAQPT